MKKLAAYSERQHDGSVAVFDPPRRSKSPVKPPVRANGEVYLSATPVELYPFDENYMELLRRRDRATQDHFFGYFGRLLRIKLRSRKLPVHVIQDVQQETFLRVMVAVYTGEVRQPERLGSYVNSVCNNILFEHYRLLSREQHVDLEAADGPDAAADLEARMIADQRTQSVHMTLDHLSDTQATILRAVLLDRDKDEVCRELDVTRDYLRVLTHRAIETFRTRYKGKRGLQGISQVPKR